MRTHESWAEAPKRALGCENQLPVWYRYRPYLPAQMGCNDERVGDGAKRRPFSAVGFNWCTAACEWQPRKVRVAFKT
eukprot:CAMPEP_0181489192 /NCGR_PEP_ID=MMETSP1110-20121109/48828_1 /TAXON_ID=174948 /ORGANISM="Symbiodinium sp., Strain CCMP421" /LENGTH=76 /DNA_ID=CAMNT_0023615963 /DNA_START=38 /DNA_END=265 /DNA_ORIENTATION=+